MSVRYDYSEWDGTQQFSDLDPDDLLAGLTDDLLAGETSTTRCGACCVAASQTADGEQVPGLRDLLDQLRRRRAEMLAEGDPDGRMAELTPPARRDRAGRTGGHRRAGRRGRSPRATSAAREVTDDVATERRMALDLQPDEPAGRIASMQHYDFVSSEARERFEELVEELRKEMVDTFFEGASEALSNHGSRGDGADARRLRRPQPHARAARARRELDPSFEQFMEQFGDMFPGDPQNLDELPRTAGPAHGRRPGGAATPTSPEQQAQLSVLMSGLMEDMDLRWQVDRLSENLQRAFPDAGWQQSYDFRGQGPMGMDRATDLASQLGQLDRMEEVLPVGLVARRPGRDRSGPGAPAHGRGRRPGAGPAGQPDQVAGRRRADRAARRAGRADAARCAPAGPKGAEPTSSDRSTRTASATTRPCAPARATTAKTPPRPTSTAIR